MRRQVDKVMEMAVLDQSTQVLERERIQLDDWVQTAETSIRPTLEQQEGRLTVAIADGAANHAIVGDRTHLVGVLRNLLDNAVRYSGDAPPDLELRLQTNPETGMGMLDVADRGVGVPEAHRERIFERFHRVPTGDRHDVKGFGLGLHYVRTILDAHGATVECLPRPGRGSLFRVQFPLAT